MKPIKQFFRLITINHLLAKNGLDQLIVSIHLFSPLRFVVYLNPWNWFRKKSRTPGEALRQTLEALGPIFVKFGQALSTRPDIFTPEITRELSQLQDKVPPFDSNQALYLIEKAFKNPANNVFAAFDETPFASASIAQVHAARLHSGEEVVVKILRPNIRKTIESDLGILKTIANLADRYWKEARRFKPKEIVEEFEKTLLNELDLRREAANAGQLRRNFKKSPLLYIPEIHWDYTQKNILVLERIYGTPITDLEALKAQGVDLEKLASRGLEIFFTQVFRDCFFHADMHPGNIFVSFKNPKEPQYICVDFGIVGSLNERDKRYIAENLIAFFNRDYRRVALLHIESGWIPKETSIEDFESAIRTVAEPIFEKPLKDISFGLLIMQLLQVARRFKMEIQPQFILLQKTLLAIEGLGRQIYPELDLWTTAKPFLEKWLKDQLSPKAFYKHLRANVPFFVEQLPYLPQTFYEFLKTNTVPTHTLQNTKQVTTTPNHKWRTGFGAGLLACVFATFGVHHFALFTLYDWTTLGLITAIVGGLLILI